MAVEEWRRRMGSLHTHPLRGVPSACQNREGIERAASGERKQGREEDEAIGFSRHHVAVQRLGRDVHGAMPQHGARGQRDVAEVGDRRRRGTVFEAAADADREAAGRDVPGAGRHTADRLLRRGAKRDKAEGKLLRSEFLSERRKELDMNTERNMKRRRSLFGSIGLSLVAWIIGGLMWGGMAAQAATTDSSLSIPVSGSAVATDGTKITFSGSVAVTSSAVTDVVGIPPFVIVTFDCSNVIATSGAGGQQVTYETRGEPGTTK